MNETDIFLCTNMEAKHRPNMEELLKKYPAVALEVREEAFTRRGTKIDVYFSLWWIVRPKNDMSWFWKEFESMK